MGRLEVLTEFGYKRDPFRGVIMETADSARVKRILNMAVDSKSMVSIIADRGHGKTSAIGMALSNIDCAVISLQTSNKEQVGIGDIESAMILELSQEPVKRTREIRARQLKRVLGEASRQGPVVLMLEEAHRLHGQTLRSLKTLREMDWLGVSPLFTVVMIGQSDPMRKRGVDEVRLRTDTVFMKGLAASEVKEYISSTVGKCFEDDAVEAISRLGRGRNFLDLQEMLITLMETAWSAGQKQVTVMEVFDVYGGGAKEIMKQLNMTNTDLRKETGLSATAISFAVNENQASLTDEKYAETRKTVSDALRKRMDGKPAIHAV